MASPIFGQIGADPFSLSSSSALLGFDVVFCEMFSRFPLCSLSLVFPQGMFSRTLRRSLAPFPFASLLLRPNTFQQLHTTKEHRRGRLPLFHDYDFCNSSFFGLTSF